MSPRTYPCPSHLGPRQRAPRCDWARSYTEPRDPVTGAGWESHPIRQLKHAIDCLQEKCSHLEYAPNMGTSNVGGAEATAAQAPLIAKGVAFVVSKTT